MTYARCLAALGLVAAGCSAPAPPLPSQVPPRVAAATAIGRVDAEAPIDFVLALQLRDPDGLAALLRDQATPGSGRYRQFLTPAAFADAFAPTSADYARVVTALRARGLQVSESPSRTSVSVHGRAAEVEKAVGITLDRWIDQVGAFYAPSTEPRYPAEIQAFTAGAAGLDDAGGWWSHRMPIPAGASGSYEPADLIKQYDSNGAGVGLGDGETVAILGSGFPPTVADVDGYVQKFALPVNRAAQYSQVFVGGPNRDPNGLAQNEYTENLLDVDMVLALAPHANVVHVFTATNGPGLFSDGIVYIVNHVAQAHQVSVSFGTCERGAAGEVLVMNQLFAQAKAEGQQWFFASGDSGTDGCRDGRGNKVLSIGWPASSPYVLSVGGTEIVATSEEAWFGGGGGQSEIIDKPAFQKPQPGDTRARTPGDGVRDQPDIAALAGSPGVAIYGQGQLIPGVQGTSAATPMWAAVWALLDEAKGSHLGFSDGAERLYRVGASAGSGLRDITVGNNGNGSTPGYNATVGYDLATGWGVPDVAKLVTQW